MSKYLLLILAMLGGGLIILFTNGKNKSKEESNEVVGASSFLKEPLEEMKEAYEKINNGAKVKLIFNQSSQN